MYLEGTNTLLMNTVNQLIFENTSFRVEPFLHYFEVIEFRDHLNLLEVVK